MKIIIAFKAILFILFILFYPYLIFQTERGEIAGILGAIGTILWAVTLIAGMITIIIWVLRKLGFGNERG